MWPNAIHKDASEQEERKGKWSRSMWVSEWVSARAAFLSGNSWKTFSLLSVSSRHIPLNFYALLSLSLSLRQVERTLARSLAGSIMRRLRHRCSSSCIQNFEHFKPDYLIVGELSARRNPTNFKWRNNRASQREYLLSQSHTAPDLGCCVFARGEEASNVGVLLKLKIESPRVTMYV